jgi:transposase
MTQTTEAKGSAVSSGTLLMAFELGASVWKIATGTEGTRSKRECLMKCGVKVALVKEIAKAKDKLKLPKGCKVRSCYEAGRDGFWVHHFLRELGIDNVVVDSSSILVTRQRRRAKTDHLDALALLDLLTRFHAGEANTWKVVTVPTTEQEDARRMHRERERLVGERTGHQTRIKALLSVYGTRVENAKLADLAKLQQWNGKPLPPELRAELKREQDRLVLVDQQIRDLEKDRKKRLEAAATDSLAGKRIDRAMGHSLMLISLFGIGANSAWLLSNELFWRAFANRRQAASATGLVPTPYNSGNSIREQGISKAGNPLLRKTLIELAWSWLRFQPQSKLSQWFQQRFAGGGSRTRRIGIVAMARRLVVDLWRYLETGVVPEGAIMRNARVAEGAA